MARIAKATGDADLRDKAVRMMKAWTECFERSGDAGAHYPFDKTFCGLFDLHLYAGVAEALPLLRRLTAAASRNLPRARQLATPADQQAAAGGCEEWYTLSENQYRAYLATGESMFRDFGDVWRYEAYWSRFQDTARPPVLRVHAYSHVNSFNALPLAYAVSGDTRYLRMARNAYDFVRGSQMFSTGGFGPGERLVGYDGDLGRSLELHADTAEVPCGSWAGFKLSRYLINYTGEARYGDWIERLVYNGIGAAHARRWRDVLLRRLPHRQRNPIVPVGPLAVLLGQLHTGGGRLRQPDLLPGCQRTLCESLRAFGSELDAEWTGRKTHPGNRVSGEGRNPASH
jgi:hypothetical protein